MRKINYFLSALWLSLTISHAVASGPFPPAAGQPGSTAIHLNSTDFVSWATGIELHRGYINAADTSVHHSGSNRATFGLPSTPIGQASGITTDVVSLGDGGIATITFDRPIINGTGADFAVFENGFSDTFLELAFVEVSSDGRHFVRFPAVSLTPTNTQVGGFGSLNSTNIHNLAGKYRLGFGTPFDLDELKDSANIDIHGVRFVRVVDVVGCIACNKATLDSRGNLVNDPWPTPFHSGGFDLDGVGIINAGNPFQIASYAGLTLDEDSVFRPTQEGSFSANPFQFYYSADQWSWSGITYSRRTTVTGNNLTDQFTATTRSGMAGAGSMYLVAFVPLNWQSPTFDPIPIQISVADGTAAQVNGFYVTNTVWAYNSMRNGDMFSKKFGGASGNDPDWFKLMVWGIKENGSITDTVHFYLADFRFENNYFDYIVDGWRWLDLARLGEVKSLHVSIASSDKGAFGINTPTYFALDQLTLAPRNAVSTARPISDNDLRFGDNAKSRVYPNPFAETLIIEAAAGSRVTIINTLGQIISEHTSQGTPIHLHDLPTGWHIVRIIKDGKIETFKVIRN